MRGSPARTRRPSGSRTSRPGTILWRPPDHVDPTSVAVGRIDRGPGRIYRGVRQARAQDRGRLTRGLLHEQGTEETEPGAADRVLRGAGAAGLALQERDA